jgi:hypothetical protein
MMVPMGSLYGTYGIPIRHCTKPRPFYKKRCLINLTDSANILLVRRPNKVRKKLKILAQTDEPFWRYDPPK